METKLIVNLTSGSVENPHLLGDLTDALKAQGIEVETFVTSPEENGEGLAKSAAKAGAKLVIVAGGDGTIEAVARGLIHSQTTMGIIPLGTRNNIAACLKIPNDPIKAIQILIEGDRNQFDMGKINDHYFMEVVGIGLEATLFPRGDEVKEGIKKNYLAAFMSLISGIRTFLQFKHHRLFLRFDDKRLRSLRTLQVNICNSPRYGVEFALAPEAKMNDGKLDVVYIDRPSKWDHLRHFFSAMGGEKLNHARLKTYSAAKIEVKSYPPAEVHADGKFLGTTPIMVEVVPLAVWICVPNPELLAKFKEDRSGLDNLNQSSESLATNPDQVFID